MLYPLPTASPWTTPLAPENVGAGMSKTASEVPPVFAEVGSPGLFTFDPGEVFGSSLQPTAKKTARASTASNCFIAFDDELMIVVAGSIAAGVRKRV